MPVTGPKSPGNALYFANYSSPMKLMDIARDVIGLTLLKRQDRTDLPMRKRDPGYSAAKDAAITIARACTFAPTGVVTNAKVLFR